MTTPIHTNKHTSWLVYKSQIQNPTSPKSIRSLTNVHKIIPENFKYNTNTIIKVLNQHKKMLDGAEYSSTSECFSDFNLPTSKKKRSSKNKRRFSDEQIRSLEIMFESETKLEPKKKLQLAKELGLQPRQVAIWFQNKRARWKSKQIEKDYNVLLSNYNNLASQFECLNKEKQSLLSQLQKLKKEKVGKPELEKQSQIQETESNKSSDGESDYEKADLKMKNVNNSFEGMLSDDDSSMKAEFLGLDEENELLKMVEHAAADSSLTSADNQEWGSLDSDDQNYQWWDFWS